MEAKKVSGGVKAPRYPQRDKMLKAPGKAKKRGNRSRLSNIGSITE